MSEKKSHIQTNLYTPTGETVGRGSWGNVDVYIDNAGNKYAIKTLELTEKGRAHLETKGQNLDDIIRNETLPPEAAIHNIVPRHIARDDNGTPYIAMALIEGKDLSETLYDQGLKSAYRVTSDILEALSYIHNLREVSGDLRNPNVRARSHRDVKPANILIDPDGNALLTDFGSCDTITIPESDGDIYPIPEKNYLAPEFSDLDGNEKFKVTPEGDVFGLGSILYEMIAKKGLYEGLTNGDKRDQYKINKKIMTNIPRAFQSFLMKSLAVNPDERYQNGSEMKVGLEKAVKKYGKTTWRSRARRWGTAAAAALVVAAGVAGFVTLDSQKGNLKQEVLKASQEKEIERKRRLVKLYLQRQRRDGLGEKFSPQYVYSYNDYINDGEFSGWLFKFPESIKLGIASFIDPNAVYSSVMDAGLDPNDSALIYAQIEPFLQKKNYRVYWEIWDLENSTHDAISRSMRNRMAASVDKKWGAAKQVYEQEQKELQVQKEKELERVERKRKAEESLPLGYGGGRSSATEISPILYFDPSKK